MNKPEIKALILETVPNIENDQLKDNSTFESLKIDSLDQMSIVLAIQEATGRQIPDENIEGLNSINAIEEFVKENQNKSICYCNGGDRSQEDKIREAETCKNLGIDLKFGIGGIHKLESSSNLTKNHLSETEERPWGKFHIIAKGKGCLPLQVINEPG